MPWDESKPAGTDAVNTVDNTVRADKVTLRTALDAEHVFNASDQSGLHRQGAAVLIRDVAANLGTYTPRAGQLFFATDTHVLYMGNGATPCAWQRESPRRNCVRSSYVQQGDVLDATDWTPLPNMSAVAITTTGDSGSTCDLLITASLTAECDDAEKSILFVLYLDGAAVTAAAAGQAEVPHVPGSAGKEPHRTVTLTWLATSVAQGAHTVAIRYKVSEAAVTGNLTTDFNANIAVVEL